MLQHHNAGAGEDAVGGGGWRQPLCVWQRRKRQAQHRLARHHRGGGGCTGRKGEKQRKLDREGAERVSNAVGRRHRKRASPWRPTAHRPLPRDPRAPYAPTRRLQASGGASPRRRRGGQPTRWPHHSAFAQRSAASRTTRAQRARRRERCSALRRLASIKRQADALPRRRCHRGRRLARERSQDEADTDCASWCRCDTSLM